jgi:hypothetical protein
MSATTLKKINKRAKQIRAKHPGKSWKAAQKQAGKEVSSGKVGSVRKRRKAPKKIGKVAHHKPRVKKAAPKYYAREVHEVRRVGAIKYTGGKVSISGTVSAVTKRDYDKARHRYLSLVEQLGWYMALISQEKNSREKKRLQQRARGLKNAVAAEKRLMDSLESRIK